MSERLSRHDINTFKASRAIMITSTVTEGISLEDFLDNPRIAFLAMRFYSPIPGKTLDKSSDKARKQGRAIA